MLRVSADVVTQAGRYSRCSGDRTAVAARHPWPDRFAINRTAGTTTSRCWADQHLRVQIRYSRKCTAVR